MLHPCTHVVWIRAVGMLVVTLGYYYLYAARNKLAPFLMAAVYGRLPVLLFFLCSRCSV
jgi:hypothetical protein